MCFKSKVEITHSSNPYNVSSKISTKFSSKFEHTSICIMNVETIKRRCCVSLSKTENWTSERKSEQQTSPTSPSFA